MESRNKYPHIERDPRPAPGLRVPLFDRLTSSGEAFGSQAEPFRTLTPAAVIESVRRDLQRLLNTRTRPGDGSAGTSLNYGLPDFAHVSPSDIAAYETLALSIGRVIEAFEPRIQQVRVTLKFDPADPRVLVGSIEGKIRMSLIAEPVSFPLEISAGSGGAMVGKSSAMAQGA
jgi:type VI secretion system lysozyme-like protein